MLRSCQNFIFETTKLVSKRNKPFLFETNLALERLQKGPEMFITTLKCIETTRNSLERAKNALVFAQKLPKMFITNQRCLEMI